MQDKDKEQPSQGKVCNTAGGYPKPQIPQGRGHRPPIDSPMQHYMGRADLVVPMSMQQHQARDYPAKRGKEHPDALALRPRQTRTSAEQAAKIRRELEAAGKVLPPGTHRPVLPGEETGVPSPRSTNT